MASYNVQGVIQFFLHSTRITYTSFSLSSSMVDFKNRSVIASKSLSVK